MTPQQEAKELREHHVKDGLRAFSQLVRKIGSRLSFPAQMIPTAQDSKEVRREKVEFLNSLLKPYREIEEYLEAWLPRKLAQSSTTMERKMTTLVRVSLIREQSGSSFENTDLEDYLTSYLRDEFEAEMKAVQREPMEMALSSEMMKYLPSSLVVETDPDGKIETISDIFHNDHKTVEVKMKHMVSLVDKYNFIVKQVKADLSAPDLETRIKACILMIILETGVRPGGVGESNLKDEEGKLVKVNGEPVRVETFGASGRKHSHIKRILKDAVELEFRGKASTINRARVTTPEVVSLIKELAETAELREMYLYTEGFMFTKKHPKTGAEMIVTDDSVRAYFKRIAGGTLVPTDFRKLRATQVLFDSLKKQQRKLLARIRTFVEQESENLAERVAEEVSATINKAISEAQVAISHSDTDVTINQYINPLVVLKYLERGGLKGQLKDAIMTNPEHLKFDPQMFIDRAMGNMRTASFFRLAFLGWGRVANLMSLVETIEDSLSEKSSSLLDTIEQLEGALDD